ncbi:unnamed protein product [Notodromas monacha]|uniref:Transmembrane protein 11 n=1 Tax=Notodromas monacha TaxID=399045 RepID=A0A7R9GFW7_9CRUS|nr:unnamed protein product [Notodromas monacha]CAG0919763.1 unnamed protein product [Notodromas monacha]
MSSPVFVREVYNGENALEIFEDTLERALDEQHELIVIEPAQLGKQTENWIAFGNCIQNTSILTGFGSVVAGALLPEKPLSYVTLGTISVFLTALYGVSWLTDPCVAYQVERNWGRVQCDPKYFRLFSDNGQNSSASVVLVRRKRKLSCFLHASVSICAVCVCAWNLIKLRRVA